MPARDPAGRTDRPGGAPVPGVDALAAEVESLAAAEGAAGDEGAGGDGGAAGDGRVDRLRAHARQARQRGEGMLDGARARSGVVDAVVLAVEHDRRTAGNVLAGAVAFRLFVYILPLVLGVVALGGVVHGVDEDAATSVGDGLGMGAYVLDSVGTAVEQSSRALWVLLPLAAVAIYTGGLGVAKVLSAIHAIAWGLPVGRLRRPPATAAATFGIAVGTLVLVAGLHAVRHRSLPVGTVATLLGLVPLVLLWLLVSRLLPRDPRAGWVALLPGALLVGTTIWAAQLVSVYFLAHRVQRASQLYGSLGAAAAILAWLYVVSRLMVGSAMLNATLWQRSSAAGRPPPPPGPGS
jgi:uncharacterized BrkB/YihY/UPF0761 family membrane protein